MCLSLGMQGKKIYQEKLFASFSLSSRVPKENFYRRLREVLDLHYLYKQTEKFYGKSGQKSLDPVVFFKFCLVGYLENIISDRKLITHCSMRLDILLFLGYDIDDELPWHSTISRTRQLFPEELFEDVFTHVLKMCVEKGMVSGHSQAIDSAPVKANASMDTLELKVPEASLEEHLHRIRHISNTDKEEYAVRKRKAKEDKSDEDQRTNTASKAELQAIESRTKKWSKDQNMRQGAGRKNAKYTSNKTHYSPTDPDARISVKPGKARKLNYLSQLSVDTGHHVITDIRAYHADGKDNQYLQDIVNRLKPRLQKQGLLWRNCIADTGYSSGENYAFLEEIGLESYIPPHGTYKGGPDGFIYHKEEDYYLCPNKEKIPFTKVFRETKTKTLKKEYRGTTYQCTDCPLRSKCLSATAKEKRFTVTYYRAEYERNTKRVTSKLGKYMKGKRQSTVEPVFGTLTQFMGMRKVNTLGIEQANKVMHMAAIAYNLKKYLKFTQKLQKSKAKSLCFARLIKIVLSEIINSILSIVNYTQNRLQLI